MRRSVGILALATGWAVLLTPPLRAAHVVERIIARVNSEIITQRQFERERNKLRDELSQQNSGPDLEAKLNDESKNLLRNLIDQSLMVQKAKDENIDVETDLIKQLDQMRKQDNLATIEDLQKEAEKEGIIWEDFKDQLRRQLLMQEVISRYVGSRIVITREEEKKYYEAHKEEFKSAGVVHLAEILISNEKYKPEEADKRAKAAEDELKGGAKWSEVVKKYSDGPTDRGGDINPQKTSSLNPTLLAAINKLDINDFTEPIQVHSGYLILRLIERFSPGIPTFEEVENRVQEVMYSQQMEPKMREYLTQLRKESYIFLAPGYVDTGAETPGSALTAEKAQ
ncbi:MAG TPA: peptidyl-prolyl cis-trans isomerase [Terriglobia bacterium]|nr:peptidyl-prolyl cis-trans isomerase [Terriglobia bacterium]